jgi:hypothetical protein
MLCIMINNVSTSMYGLRIHHYDQCPAMADVLPKWEVFEASPVNLTTVNSFSSCCVNLNWRDGRHDEA